MLALQEVTKQFLKYCSLQKQTENGENEVLLMEQHTLKNVNNCLNANIYSYLETSGDQSSNPNLNVVHFFNTRAN
jgi:hypothetical protein